MKDKKVTDNSKLILGFFVGFAGMSLGLIVFLFLQGILSNTTTLTQNQSQPQQPQVPGFTVCKNVTTDNFKSIYAYCIFTLDSDVIINSDGTINRTPKSHAHCQFDYTMELPFGTRNIYKLRVFYFDQNTFLPQNSVFVVDNKIQLNETFWNNMADDQQLRTESQSRYVLGRNGEKEFGILYRIDAYYFSTKEQCTVEPCVNQTVDILNNTVTASLCVMKYPEVKP